MAAFEIAAYQNNYEATNYFRQQQNSGFEQARVASVQETPEFPKSNNGINTRAGLVPVNDPGQTGRQASSPPSGGRGKLVDLLA